MAMYHATDGMNIPQHEKGDTHRCLKKTQQLFLGPEQLVSQ